MVCSSWKEDQKCNSGQVKFEMNFRHLSGDVKWATDYMGLKFR